MPTIKYIDSLTETTSLENKIGFCDSDPHNDAESNKYKFDISIDGSSTNSHVPTSSAVENRINQLISLIPPYERAQQISIVYFGKHGSPTNNGTNDDDALDSIANALAKARSLGTLHVVLYCSDSNEYDEDLTGINGLSNYVEIWAPNATISGNIAIVDNSKCCVTAFTLGDDTSSCSTDEYQAQLTLNAIKCIHYSAYNFNNSSGKIILNCDEVFTSTLSTCTFNNSNNELIVNSRFAGAVNILDSTSPSTPTNIANYNISSIIGIHQFSYCKVTGSVNHIAPSMMPVFSTNCVCSLNISITESSISVGSNVSGSIYVSNNTSSTKIPDSSYANLRIIDGRTPQNFVNQSINPSTTNYTWYRIGKQTTLANAYSSYFVKMFGSNLNISPCVVRLDVFTNGLGYTNVFYKCIYGSEHNLRPSFRVYNDTSGRANVYVLIPPNATFEVSSTNSNKGSLKFYGVFDDCGTGADPTGISGYTLKYDTKVDDIYYYIPSTVSWTGPFSMAANKINVTAVNEGSITVNFALVSTTGDGNNSYVRSSGAVFQPKWRPYENQYMNVAWVKEKNSSIVGATIEISTDGYITLYKNFETVFSTVSGQPFIIYPFTFSMPIMPNG